MTRCQRTLSFPELHDWGQAVLLGLGKHQEGGQDKGKVKTRSTSQIRFALSLKCLLPLFSWLSEGKENGVTAVGTTGHLPRCTHMWTKDETAHLDPVLRHSGAPLQGDGKQGKKRQRNAHIYFLQVATGRPFHFSQLLCWENKSGFFKVLVWPSGH